METYGNEEEDEKREARKGAWLKERKPSGSSSPFDGEIYNVGTNMKHQLEMQVEPPSNQSEEDS